MKIMKIMKETIDLVFSFDTTGSMATCIAQVRRNVQETVRRLFYEIPNLRVGIITHGDYCDGPDVINSLDLTNNEREICDFIMNAPNTDGGDRDECYELVLHHARSLHWTSGRNKALVLIGDAEPHEKGYSFEGKVNDLDWHNERDLLVEAGINIYPIQALGRFGNGIFYNAIARNPENIKLDLYQFSDIVDLLTALTYQRAGRKEKVQEILRRASYNMRKVGDRLTGKKISIDKTSKKAPDEMLDGRFQVFAVTEDTRISTFVRDNGLVFKKGRGFYEWTKTETIQNYKEIVAQNRETGGMHIKGHARRLLKLPKDTIRTRPSNPKYSGFIQSTSENRKLIGGTKFLYEVEGF